MNFNPVFSWPVVIIISVLLGALSLIITWQSCSTLKRKLRYVVSLLRSAAVFLILLLLFNLGDWKSDTSNDEKPWIVMLDGSESMTALDDGESRSDRALLIDGQIQDLAKESGVSVRRFQFADELVELSDGDSYQFDGQSSDISTSSDRLLSQLASQGVNPAGVVVLSDGRQTSSGKSEQVSLRAKSMQVPFHTLTIGGEKVFSGIRVSTPRKSLTAFPGQALTLAAVVELSEVESQRIELALKNAQGEVISQKAVLVQNNEKQVVSFAINAPEESTQLKLEVVSQSDNIKIDGDGAEYRIKVLNDKARVFIAEGAPYWDSKFLAQMMRRQAHMELSSVHRLSADRWFQVDSSESLPHESSTSVFPDTIEKLMQYDLIVFGKNCEHFLNEERIKILKVFVRDLGGAVLFARSKPYTGELTSLEVLEPVRWADGLREDFHFHPTNEGAIAGLFGDALPDSDSALWSSLPSLKDAHRIEGVKPFTRVLATGKANGIGGQSHEFPLLMVRRYGQGVSGLVNADGLWKWDFYPEARDLGNMYEEFWTQLIHWMLSYSEFLPGQDYALHLSADEIRPAEPVLIRAAYRGEGEVAAPEVVVRSAALSQELVIVPAEEIDDTGQLKWIACYEPEVPGNYHFELRASNDNNLSLPDVSLLVLTPPAEMDELSADPYFMETFAMQTDGLVLEDDSWLDVLSEKMSAIQQIDRDGVAYWQPSWAKWMLATLIALLLSAEWWVRRRNGLS